MSKTEFDSLKVKLEEVLNTECYDRCTVTITRGNPRSTIYVRASRKNDDLPLNFGIMKIVSDALGTDKIDHSSYSTDGCDTCGNGSVHTWTLECRKCKV
jgi:hypothetical protein